MDEKVYKYVQVSYDHNSSDRTYSYKTTLENINVGDTVLVDCNGNDVYGTVESIDEYTEKTAPYPVDKTKDIIEVVEKFDDVDKEFDSIDEIKDYLKNEYVKAHWKTPEPGYYIENNQIIHHMGCLDYDMRIFKVRDFMIKNNYVDEQYYNREKYHEIFDEDFHKYDFRNLDIKRVSYLFLRTFNIERICEGSINNLVTSGIMLKLVERAEQLKKSGCNYEQK